MFMNKSNTLKRYHFSEFICRFTLQNCFNSIFMTFNSMIVKCVKKNKGQEWETWCFSYQGLLWSYVFKRLSYWHRYTHTHTHTQGWEKVNRAIVTLLDFISCCNNHDLYVFFHMNDCKPFAHPWIYVKYIWFWAWLSILPVKVIFLSLWMFKYCSRKDCTFRGYFCCSIL